MINSRLKSLRYLTTAAVFAAMIFVTTYFLHIPIGSSGYIHVGDAFIYLAACFLPTPYAAAAAAIGAALSDGFSAPIYIPATLIIKPVLTLFFTNKSDKFVTNRNVLAIILAGITGLLGYFLWEWRCFGLYPAAINVPMGSIQPFAGAILFLVVGTALDRMNFKKRFKIS